MEERLSFTRVLARMFSAKHSKLSIENRHLWNTFLGRSADYIQPWSLDSLFFLVHRFQDSSPSVRAECVKYSRYFLVYHPNLVEDTTGMQCADCELSCLSLAKLLERLHDSEEKVRLEAVKTVCEVASESLTTVPVKVTSIFCSTF